MSRPIPPRVREMHSLYQRPGQTLQTVADRFGVSKNGVWMSFNRYALPLRTGGNGKSREPVPLLKTGAQARKEWCGQCELRVSPADVARCGSRWCKAGSAAANDTERGRTAQMQEQANG